MSLREGVERLLYSEAKLLDERRYAEWLDLFTQDAEYWIPSWTSESDTITSPKKELSLLYLDRKGLETYVKRLLTGEAHTYEPPGRTSHLITNVLLDDSDRNRESSKGTEVRVFCNWLMHVYRMRRQELFGGGSEYLLRHQEGGSLKIASKKVKIINDWIRRGQLLLV